MKRRPILCLDFDGVIHSYESGWEGADVIPDPPVSGALEFMFDALTWFDVQVFSSRSNQPGGIQAMQKWLREWAVNLLRDGRFEGDPMLGWLDKIGWPTEKPPATVSIDDRCLLFTGQFPDPVRLVGFQPWNKSTEKRRCKDCKWARVITKIMEVMGEDMDVIDRIECRRFPPSRTFWGSSFPTTTEVCGEFSRNGTATQH